MGKKSFQFLFILSIFIILSNLPLESKVAASKNLPRTFGFSLLGGGGYTFGNIDKSVNDSAAAKIAYHGGLSLFFATGTILKFPWLHRVGIEFLEHGFARSAEKNYRAVSMSFFISGTPFFLWIESLKWLLLDFGLSGYIGEVGGSKNPFGAKTGVGVEFPITSFMRISTLLRNDLVFARSFIIKSELSILTSFFF